MARNSSAVHTVTGPITLDDLRWLVEQCKSLAPDSPVDVAGRKDYNQMDWDPATITVRGKPA